MTKKILFSLIIIVAIIGVFTPLINASLNPCTDMWERCIEINGYPNQDCELLWEICIHTLYDD